MNKKITLLVVSLIMIFAVISRAQQSPANKWETEIKKFEDSDRKNPPAKGAVLFIGSSSIREWQTLASDFPGIKTINRGFGGSEIADSTYFVDRIVIPYKPKAVFLYAGDNDLANGKTPQQVFEDFKTFVSRIHRSLPATKIAFISIKPSPARAALLQNMKDANALIKAYAVHNRRLVYVDVFTPMLGTDGSPRDDLFGLDKLHMNREGYRLWRSVIAPYIR